MKTTLVTFTRGLDSDFINCTVLNNNPATKI